MRLIDINKKRRFETKDIVKRKGIIVPDQIRIKGYPLEKPNTVFNASFKFTENGLRIFSRACFGYYTYACSIIEFEIPLEDISFRSEKKYEAEISIFPDSKYDFWGVEDPRYYKIDNMELITYCGRTLSYLSNEISMEKTLPVTAIRQGERWKKIAVFRMPEDIRWIMSSDKNAFLFKVEDEILLFHRPHIAEKRFYLSVSKVEKEKIMNPKELEEVEIKEILFFAEPASFESKIGWATPPIKIGNENLVFIHAMGKDHVYRVLCALVDNKGYICSVTPFYIMEPREIYEIYGDRPYVVFPCGAQLFGEKIYITYGASDSFIGIGELEVDHLLDILQKNRIY